MIELLRRLFEYDRWATELVLEQLKAEKITDAQILRWMSHIANAHLIWQVRLKGQPSPYGIFQEYSLEEIAQLFAQVYRNWTDWLDTQDEVSINARISYTDSRGVAFGNTPQQICYHVVNHSTHHRGQVVARIRALGYVPKATDFIFFARDPKQS